MLTESELLRLKEMIEDPETGLAAVYNLATGAPAKTLENIKQNGIELPHSKVITATEDRLLINGRDLLVKGDKGDLGPQGISGASKYLDSFAISGKHGIGPEQIIYEKELNISENSPVRICISSQHSIQFKHPYIVQSYSLYVDGKISGERNRACFRNRDYPNLPVYFSRTDEFIVSDLEPGNHKFEIKIAESETHSDLMPWLNVGVSYL